METSKIQLTKIKLSQVKLHQVKTKQTIDRSDETVMVFVSGKMICIDQLREKLNVCKLTYITISSNLNSTMSGYSIHIVKSDVDVRIGYTYYHRC